MLDMTELFNCGFVRGRVLLLPQTTNSAHLCDVAHQILSERFSFTQEKRFFKPLYQKFLQKVKNKKDKWKQSQITKDEYIAYFSEKNGWT